ncbi:hypothetical protein DICSQDRAFT_55428 [Dichomitus squalens LYAD-421 SS1]|uniref:Uncharacterized protein n=1 Tax=Dichomitus squalens TaxID=114155 RepID=A0A4Q9Q4C5_9APHY|nr:uncharacterized protein DICSQDRAFT_55428 [Dichomitus squalens LYAD-421 SS1]EJF63511.1 hypothetical protein DICSQDRAFT_55428 [Dichomitus squalens LYAD-421 SS1]TBU62203.1 hypothetical protein BD310DRAFT_843764 [Dichomitus squalens]
MSSTRRHDLADNANKTDESQTFKKPFQTVGRPPVTERDIHEQYMQDPPQNVPYEPTTDRSTIGTKEGAREQADPQQQGVLGHPGVGKALKQDVLEEMTTEGSVHPHNPVS